MKASTPKPAAAPAIPVFPQTRHRLRPDPRTAVQVPKAEKRDNIFSKSRDTRENRDMRQMKTSHNAQTFPHGK
jgi:hypothetical protein